MTHVLAALWSSEVLHVLRLRQATFRRDLPRHVDAFAAWWARIAASEGVTSALVVLDPDRRCRRAASAGSGPTRRHDRPRYRDYADAAAALSRR